MSYLTIDLLENTSRLVDVYWTGLSTPQVEWGFGLSSSWPDEFAERLGNDLLSYVQRGFRLLLYTCSADVSGFNREVGSVCGECRGMCGKVQECRGMYGEHVGMCGTWGIGSWSTDDDWECRSWGCVNRGNCWRLCWPMEAGLIGKAVLRLCSLLMMLMLLCWYVERLWQICHSVGHPFCGPILSAWKIPPLEDAQSDE